MVSIFFLNFAKLTKNLSGDMLEKQDDDSSAVGTSKNCTASKKEGGFAETATRTKKVNHEKNELCAPGAGFSASYKKPPVLDLWPYAAFDAGFDR